MATAAAARVGLQLGEQHDYGVDGTLSQLIIRDPVFNGDGSHPVPSGIKIDFQLKCSSNWRIENDAVVYSLKGKNYNDIATRPEAATRMILLLMCLPSQQIDDWCTHIEENLILRRCIYYMHVVGERVKERSTKQIRIPRANLFTPAAVRALLEAEQQRLEAQFQ